ncbi:MAG TPA: hypothetical protein VL326_33015 [Kofleriaceae bacterium]|nr:hypothetical protein [Kofleriaceae bacterium]
MKERHRISRWAYLLVSATAVTGCDNVFRIDHLNYRGDAPGVGADAEPHDPDARPTDAPAADAPKLACANGTPLLHDAFNSSATPCDPWGYDYFDVGVSVSQNGTLNVSSYAAGAAVGGCANIMAGKLPFTGDGVMAKVDAIITGGNAYNVLEIQGPPDLVIKQYGATLAFQTAASVDIGSTNYTSAQKYWRIRPDPNNPDTRIVGELSTDGSTWNNLGTVTVASVPSTVGIQLAFGTNSGGGTGVARVDELFVCP